MWKIFVTTIGVVFSVLILTGVGYLSYDMYMTKYPTCDSHAVVIAKVKDALNSTQLADEFGIKIVRLENIEESLYDRGRKTRLCYATAVLDNGKTTQVAFRIIGQKNSYHLEAEFTKVVDVVLDEVIKRWEELLTTAEESVNAGKNAELPENTNHAEKVSVEESESVVSADVNSVEESSENVEENEALENAEVAQTAEENQ